MNILLIEDNEGDRLLMREAFRLLYPQDHMKAISDGAEAWDYLRRYSDIDLVILDLNLPKKDGLEILMEIRRDEKLKSLPVVILTTSKLQADQQASELLQANGCFTKPMRFPDLLELVKSMRQLAGRP